MAGPSQNHRCPGGTSSKSQAPPEEFEGFPASKTAWTTENDGLLIKETIHAYPHARCETRSFLNILVLVLEKKSPSSTVFATTQLPHFSILPRSSTETSPKSRPGEVQADPLTSQTLGAQKKMAKAATAERSNTWRSHRPRVGKKCRSARWPDWRIRVCRYGWCFFEEIEENPIENPPTSNVSNSNWVFSWKKNTSDHFWEFCRVQLLKFCVRSPNRTPPKKIGGWVPRTTPIKNYCHQKQRLIKIVIRPAIKPLFSGEGSFEGGTFGGSSRLVSS